ncbi:MAG: methyltransferase family protein [Planctomycetaceae bacterium]|nr:methyltransferase family protein [Planctomycetaceae bacterium]
MHPSTYERCQEFVERYLADLPRLKIADVGSYDVNGTYRPLLNRQGWEYAGFDLEAGPNVDVLLQSPESWRLDSRYIGHFDVVISGQVLEHVQRPWKWIHEVASLAREGGLIWVCAPNTWEFHEFPIDCWRVWPDGMRALFEDADIDVLDCSFVGRDTVAIGRKRTPVWNESSQTASQRGIPAATQMDSADSGLLTIGQSSRSIEPALWDRYLELCQQPSDINEHLSCLLRMAHCSKDVVEFGVRGAVSTTALLCGQPRRFRAFDLVRLPVVSELEKLSGNCAFQFEQRNCLEVDLKSTDVLFIDTLHTAAQLAAELNRHAVNVKRWIVLHDTSTFGSIGEDGGPGLWDAVTAFLAANSNWFIAVRYLHNNGLTILQNREFRVGLSTMLELFGGPCKLLVPGSHRHNLFLHSTGEVLERADAIPNDAHDPSSFNPTPSIARQRWRFEGAGLIISNEVGVDLIRLNIDHDAGELHGETLQNERLPVAMRHAGQRLIRPSQRSATSAFGVVIGSYAQPLWVRANVAAIRNRLGTNVPILICDDASPNDEMTILRRIADEQDCQLHVNPVHLGHYYGDINAIKTGITWAGHLGCQHVFKLSQRTIPIRSGWAWELSKQMTEDESAVAYQTQKGTREVRTELLGFNVDDWSSVVADAALSEPFTGLLENWFNDVCWKLFPWRHTPIPWLSRSRFAENSNVISYYGMTFDRVETLYQRLTGSSVHQF